MSDTIRKKRQEIRGAECLGKKKFKTTKKLVLLGFCYDKAI